MEILPLDSNPWMHIQVGKIKMYEKSSEQSQFLDLELSKIFTANVNLKKFKYENVTEMKNKPDLVLLQSSYL
jgi:hypothetical protein